MNQKRYTNVERFKENYVDAIQKGDLIHVSEKLDGANSSFTYDSKTGTVKAFSRNKELSANNTLRGFYDFVMNLPTDFIKQVSENGRLVFFGEWLCPHGVKYPDEAYNHFYLYDIWDTETESWCTQDFVSAIYLTFINRGIVIFQPKCFYYGEFKNWEELSNFVGETAIGAMPCGEGIVIKNQSALNEKNRRLPIYIKMVSEKFAETHKPKVKITDSERLKQQEKDYQLASTIITKQRVQKFLNKFVDEGIIPEDWDKSSLGIIAKNLPSEIYNDCLKEEPETVSQIGNFGKICSKLSLELVKGVIINGVH